MLERVQLCNKHGGHGETGPVRFEHMKTETANKVTEFCTRPAIPSFLRSGWSAQGEHCVCCDVRSHEFETLGGELFVVQHDLCAGSLYDDVA